MKLLSLEDPDILMMTYEFTNSKSGKGKQKKLWEVRVYDVYQRCSSRVVSLK